MTPRENEPSNSRAHLARLLDEIIERPERRRRITEAIERDFGQEKAVLVLDMSGFSATTIRHGIVAFLLMIHQMQRLARPCLEEHGGQLIKGEADDLFCLFESVDAAVRAGREIIERLNAANMVLPEDRRLYISVGIGYGRILNVAEQDLFGNEVNLASKLGEDLGRMGEILLTAAAREQIADDGVSCREEEVSVSGVALRYYVVEG